jgi:uncharacterized protein YaeQ
MALRSTVYRAELSVSDLDREVYGNHSLTLARHPSETEQRLMVRLLAFALHASDGLAFGRGLSTEGEADLWQLDPTGAIELWIDVGLPDVKDVRKASGRAARVVVLAYGERRLASWWDAFVAGIERLNNVSVLKLSDTDTSALESLASRSMQLTCTIQDGHVWLASDSSTVEIVPTVLRSAAFS